MAQAQRLRVKQSELPVVSKTGTLLTSAQVTQCVATTLDCTIGTIAYHRGLFPSDAFLPRRLNRTLKSPLDASIRTSQQSWSNDSQSLSQASPPSSQALQDDHVVVIQKLNMDGPSTEMKLLLEYLKGAKEAISRGYLTQLTLFVLQDPDEPNEILESYTVRFTYEEGMVHASLASPHKAASTIFPKTLRELRQECFRFLSDVDNTMRNAPLPKLPERRFIDIKLDYGGRAPLDYHPQRFRPFQGKLFFRDGNSTVSPSRLFLGSAQLHSTRLSASLALAPLPLESSREANSQGPVERHFVMKETTIAAQSSPPVIHLVELDRVFAIIRGVREFSGGTGERHRRSLFSSDEDDTLVPDRPVDTQASHQSLAFANTVTEYSSTGTLGRLPSHGLTDFETLPCEDPRLSAAPMVMPAISKRKPNAKTKPKRSTSKPQQKQHKKPKRGTKTTAATKHGAKASYRVVTPTVAKASRRPRPNALKQPQKTDLPTVNEPRQQQPLVSMKGQRSSKPTESPAGSASLPLQSVLPISTHHSSRMENPIDVSLHDGL